jgi:signal transduction histidine kinase/putative methionine-R-sulfoxide reductase with GAF domain
MAQTETISITDAMLEVSRAMTDETDLVALCRTLKATATRLTGASRASLFMLDKHKRELWTLCADGREEMIRMPAGKGAVGAVIENNECVRIDRAPEDPRFYDQIDRQTGYETRSILCAPILDRDGVARGAFELLNKRDGSFSSEDERYVTILGAQAGMAIEYVEMREDIRRTLAQQEAIAEIGRRCTIAMELDEIFQVILSVLVGECNGRGGVIHTTIHDGAAVYYGYRPGEMLTCWESGESGEEPSCIADIRAAVETDGAWGAVACGQRNGVLYARLMRSDTTVGYVAVRPRDYARRLFNDAPFEYLKIVAMQILGYIEEKEALEQRKREEKLQLLGSMIAKLVHDLKSPLSGVSGYAQLMQHRCEDEKLKSYCGAILTSLEHIETMNSELLAFVRGESVGLKRSLVELRSLVQGIIDSSRESDRYGNISIALDEGAPVTVWADRDRLIRACNNVLANARDALVEGGVIRVSVNGAQSEATIAIVDEGVGMPAAIRERVFEPFVTHGKKRGTGLGLAIVKNLIEEHGGRIHVRSAPGKGTALTIHLPLQALQEEQA